MSKNEKSKNAHHKALVSGLAEHMTSIFESSEQDVYIYLDNPHFESNLTQRR